MNRQAWLRQEAVEALAHLAQRGDREARSLMDVNLEDDVALCDNVGKFFRRQGTPEVPDFFGEFPGGV